MTRGLVAGAFLLAGFGSLAWIGFFAPLIVSIAPAIVSPEHYPILPTFSTQVIRALPYVSAVVVATGALGLVAELALFRLNRDADQRFVWSCTVGATMAVVSMVVAMSLAIGLVLLPEVTNGSAAS
jgi:hypothetical protein